RTSGSLCGRRSFGDSPGALGGPASTLRRRTSPSGRFVGRIISVANFAVMSGDEMGYWWVNQNQTLREEIEGGFVWSPKRNKNGKFNRFYENMKLIEPGDIIFSFAEQQIGHVGRATDRAVSNSKPDFGGKGENWSQDGWLVPVAWTRLAMPV